MMKVWFVSLLVVSSWVVSCSIAQFNRITISPTQVPVKASAHLAQSTLAQPLFISPLQTGTPSSERILDQTPPVTATLAKRPTSLPSRAISQHLQPAITLAQQDLAKRLNVPVETITVASAFADDFPGQTFGCPTQNKLFNNQAPAVFVPGIEVNLMVGETTYRYRGRGKYVVYCPRLKMP